MRTFIENNLQTILNRYLALDPESKKRLIDLQNKIVSIEFLQANFSIQLFFTDAKIILSTKAEAVPHTYIKGTPLSLLHVGLNREDRKKFFANDVSIEGDLELGQKVIDLFDSLEIDWDEYLSHWIGDVPARQLGKAANHFKQFGNHLRSVLLDNIKEFVHEEIDLFPPKEAIEDFYQDVDVLRMDTDRLEARIERISQWLNSKEEA